MSYNIDNDSIDNKENDKKANDDGNIDENSLDKTKQATKAANLKVVEVAGGRNQSVRFKR